MKLKLYTFLILLFLSVASKAQPCDSLTASAISFESRCASTGKIIITAVNGSGNYNYSVNGPVSTPYTSSNEITGLPAGAYTISVKDIIKNCVYTIPQPVVVDGDYQDPRFELIKTNVTCINGTDGTITIENVQFGRAPFSYSIVAPSTSAVGLTSSNGVFTGLATGNYFIQQTDSCGGIQTRNISILNYNWSITPYTVTRTDCDSADVFIGLRDVFGKVNTLDSVFNGFTYGIITPDGDTILSNSYNMRIKLGDLRRLQLFAVDKCGNRKTVTWTENKIPRVANAVTITNPTCFDFSAIVTGQQHLTNPEYCLYDSSGNSISCNSTGSFPNLAWGSYCIKITDVCYDTVITRCFNAVKPVPSVAASVTVSYGDDCNIVTVSIAGQTNLFNPVFCLYDSSDVLISCNATGIFGNVPIGKYCMKITGSICNDTTLIRCFEVMPLPVGAGTGTSFSNYDCTSFTGTITGTTGLGNATYCLFDSIGQLIRCNQTGVFDSLAYGSYCISVQVSTAAGGCADTVFTRCFNVTKPVPQLGPLRITKNCRSFTVQLQSFTNLLNPEFCLYNNGVLIDCNNTGLFENLIYGDYCISARDSCSKDTIERCFNAIPDTLGITASANPACILNQTTVRLNIQNGIAPFTVMLYSDSGMIRSINQTTNRSIVFDSLPSLPAGTAYTIVVTDSCGNRVEITASPLISVLTRSRRILPNCPGGTFPNGSSDIELTQESNLGKLIPRIIRKNGVNVNINFTISNTGQTVFTFKNLEPGTYIIRNRISNTCNTTVFDTVTILPYAYPALQNASLYRCDDNSFNIIAATSGGITPFQYEITGSIPASPSIVSAVPQTSPSFTINNGTAYSLVRLRALDVCGNASINDISTVPLVNIVVSVDGGCYNEDATLRVDSLAGATYRWYRRVLPNDSILVGTTPSYYLPVITTADTGLYYCRVVLNNGCIRRVANYYIDGLCGGLLNNNKLVLTAVKKEKQVQLNWEVFNTTGLKSFTVEVKRPGSDNFVISNGVNAHGSVSVYQLYDLYPSYGINQYRIKAVHESGQIIYSNIIPILIKETNTALLQLYPNPAKNSITILLNNKKEGWYQIKLFDMHLKQVYEMSTQASGQIKLQRPNHIQPGVYFFHLADIKANETHVLKVIFQ